MSGKVRREADAGSGSVRDIAVSDDPAQTCLTVINGTNQQVWTLKRDTLEIPVRGSSAAAGPGSSTAAHNLAADSKGTLFITETYEGKRVQGFVYKVTCLASSDQLLLENSAS